MLTDDLHLWLCNFGPEDIDFGPGEIFGYNTGSFSEKPKGLSVIKLQFKLNKQFLNNLESF